ncbi:MAG: LysR family transcriptional regulator [Pseudomonadota bacterium]|uniref:LysR family transcriptional regulator n=1 Tax=Sphingobium naphthae TaxID=1886786 RepID=UPI002B1BA12D|nr:LysR family transcriptional regulator [Pseudomonadota bacterium]
MDLMLPGAHFDLNMLVILAQLLRTRSVTRTARHMGVSQPAISRSLAQLRDLLGDPLLVRTGTGMALTRRGEELAEPVEAWLAATTTLLAPPHFDPAELQRRFRIASTDFGVAAVVAPALGAIMRAAPGASIDIVPLGSDMARALTAGEVDLVISGLDPDPAVTYERFLFLEGFRCVTLPDHPLMAGGSAEPLDVEAFLAWPHISFTVSDTGFDRIDHRLGSLAARRHVIARLPYFQAAPLLFPHPDAILTLPARLAHSLCQCHGLASRPAPEQIGQFGYRLLWNERSRRDPAVAWLSDVLAAHCGTTPHKVDA